MSRLIYLFKSTMIQLFKTNYHLMQVKGIVECSKGSILQYFRPSLKLPFVIKIIVLSIFEWPLKRGFTVLNMGPSCKG